MQTAKTTNFTIRLDTQLKKDAEQLFNDLGMTFSGAVNVFLHQALINQGLPFSISRNRQPSQTTLAAMQEARELAGNPQTRRFHSVDELFEDLEK